MRQPGRSRQTCWGPQSPQQPDAHQVLGRTTRWCELQVRPAFPNRQSLMLRGHGLGVPWAATQPPRGPPSPAPSPMKSSGLFCAANTGKRAVTGAGNSEEDAERRFPRSLPSSAPLNWPAGTRHILSSAIASSDRIPPRGRDSYLELEHGVDVGRLSRPHARLPH